jgi:hypothetical protein
MPGPQRPPIQPVANAGTEDSQDEYGALDLDMNDPELLAALGEPMLANHVNENKAKDVLVSTVSTRPSRRRSIIFNDVDLGHRRPHYDCHLPADICAF